MAVGSTPSFSTAQRRSRSGTLAKHNHSAGCGPGNRPLKRALARNMRDNKTAHRGTVRGGKPGFPRPHPRGYLTWAALQRHRFLVVDANHTPTKCFRPFARLGGERIDLHRATPRRVAGMSPPRRHYPSRNLAVRASRPLPAQSPPSFTKKKISGRHLGMFDQFARQETAPRQHREQSEATAHPGPPGTEANASRPGGRQVRSPHRHVQCPRADDNCIGAFSASARDKAIEVPRHHRTGPAQIHPRRPGPHPPKSYSSSSTTRSKFTPRGSVALSVRLGQSDCPQGLLVIEIRDTGIGIPPSPKASRILRSPRPTAPPPRIRRSERGFGIGHRQATAHRDERRHQARKSTRRTRNNRHVGHPRPLPVKNDHADMPSMPDIRAATVA